MSQQFNNNLKNQKNKFMENSIHFIEIYKVGESINLEHTSCIPIQYLQRFLNETIKSSNLKTIAILKIKFKENANKII